MTAEAATTVLAAVAAHRTDQPLHHELATLGARSVGCAWTAPVYRLLALPGDGVRRGGIVTAHHGGAAVEVELFRIGMPALGSLVCALPAPLAVGRIELAGGTALGILCTAEPAGSIDVSAYGSWPAYLAAGGLAVTS